MKSIDGEKYLYELTIPGTHDSGAMVDGYFPDTAQCQDKTIEEQLNFGIRFLDIRCRRVNKKFLIHHGDVYQKMNFDDVMTVVSRWLRANPSETIIMSLKDEYKPEDPEKEEKFGVIFSDYVKKYPIWHFGKEVPQLKDVRGRVVLLRRFNEDPLKEPDHRGLNADNRGWPYDDTATLTDPGPSIRVQDMFKVFWHGNKWKEIESLLNEAKANNPKTLYLNFTSGYDETFFTAPQIYYLAGNINPQLKKYLENTNNGKGRYGVIIMDYAKADLAKLIYEKNVTSGSAVSPIR